VAADSPWVGIGEASGTVHWLHLTGGSSQGASRSLSSGIELRELHVDAAARVALAVGTGVRVMRRSGGEWRLGEPLATEPSPMVAIAPSGEWAVTATEKSTTVWDLRVEPAVPMRRMEPVEHGVRSIAVSDDSRRLAAGSQVKRIHTWEVGPDGVTARASWDAHEGGVLALAFAPGRPLLASGSTNEAAVLWDLDTPGTPPGTRLQGIRNEVNALAFSPDGSRLAAGTRAPMDGSITDHVVMWRLDAADVAQSYVEIARGGPWYTQVVFAPDGKALLASASGTVWRFALDENELRKQFLERAGRELDAEEKARFGDGVDPAGPRKSPAR
jgi:hypothetical protein